MNRAYYSESIESFIKKLVPEIQGLLSDNNEFSLEQTQKDSWKYQIIDIKSWEEGRYHPTPTIVETAMALYNNHSVTDISRSDASSINLSQTSEEIASIIKNSRDKAEKAICFVTGVREQEKLWLV